MADMPHLDKISGALWRASRYLAAITPATSLWTSGVGLGSCQGVDSTIWIGLLAMLFVSVVISALAYHSAFRRANFGRMALILAVFNIARLLIDPTRGLSVLERARVFLQDYIMMLSSLAAAVATATPTCPDRSQQPGIPREDRTISVHEADGTSDKDSRNYFEDPEAQDSHGKLPEIDSIIRHMKGPRSQVSSRSDTSGTSISLLSGEIHLNPEKGLEFERVLRPFNRMEGSQETQTDDVSSSHPDLSHDE